MAGLEALYLREPYWIWLAVAGLWLAVRLSLGWRPLAWPAAAALVIAVAGAAGLRLGLAAEIAVFAVLAAALVAGAAYFQGIDLDAAETAQPSRPQEQSVRLVGRIARASSEFANGVGRVWIDGAEWGAELDAAESIPRGQAVRVTKVIGGVRLQVHPLQAG